MTPEDKYKIISNDFVDLFIKYSGNRDLLKRYESYSVHILNEVYAVIYLPVSLITSKSISEYGYSAIPSCFALTSTVGSEASGVNRLRRFPDFNFRGKGTIVGIVDTGIDYTNPVFQHPDGTSKILSLWDQTIDSENQYPSYRYIPYFGTEYSADQINQALKSANPLQVVPSTDNIGHGTMLAGIAAGSEDTKNNFTGIVPDADLIVVKLKQAKSIYRNFLSIPPDVPCYMENDIIWAMEYILDVSRKLNLPASICIGLGSSQGASEGAGPLNTTASVLSDFTGFVLSISAGNEGNMRRHFYSTIDSSVGYKDVELNVGENEGGFVMEVWGNPPNIYTLDITSPTNEYIPKLAESLQENKDISFFFEKTVIIIDYIMVEEDTGKQVILLRFKNPTPGIWRFKIYERGDTQGFFHIWLPSDDFISKDTYFLQSNPYTTVTVPGDSLVPITVVAYNPTTSSLYQSSGKGYTATNDIKPELAAPGVNILCPTLNHKYASITGTGAAAAHTAGIAAILLEWCIVQGNYPGIDTIGIKNFLIRGAKRSSSYTYPNQDWGYGIIDIYNSFNILKSDAVRR